MFCLFSPGEDQLPVANLAARKIDKTGETVTVTGKTVTVTGETVTVTGKTVTTCPHLVRTNCLSPVLQASARRLHSLL